MIKPLHANRRRGYSLTVVLIFLILLFALWSTVFRTTSSLLRIETNRVLQQTRDQGAMNALAQAIQLLQYSKPNPSRRQFTYGVTVSVPNTDGTCGTATLKYTVVYTAAPIAGDPNRWQIQVSPGTASVQLPVISSNIVWTGTN
jgi:Tfp pilus assembly protein PilX